MNNKFNMIMAAGLVLFAVSACRESSVDDLKNIYPAPDDYGFTEITDLGVEKEDAYNVFTVSLADDDSNELVLKFVSGGYFLPAGEYAPANADAAASGKYIADESYLGKNGVKTYISSGIVSVKKSGDSYAISGALWLDNEQEDIIRFNTTGSLVYERNATTLSGIYNAKATSMEGGITQIELGMHTGGITPSFDGENWVFAGSGSVVELFLYVDGSTLLPGTYTPKDVEILEGFALSGYEAGTFAKGCIYNLVIIPGTLEIPLSMFSKISNVVDGVTDAENIKFITSGQVVVGKTGDIYTVTVDNGDTYAIYEGEIDGLENGGEEPEPGPEPGEDLVLTDVSFAGITPMEGGISQVEMKFTTEGLTATPDGDNWTFNGSGSVVDLFLYVDGSTLLSGSYTPNDVDILEGLVLSGYEAGTFAKGYQYMLMGVIPLRMFSKYNPVVDGVEDTDNGQYLTSGEIAVSKAGDIYTIVIDCGDFQARYEGEIVGFN